MAQPLMSDPPRRPRLRLVAGAKNFRPSPLASIGPVGGEEVRLEVEFVGLTEAEQHRALAAFPGGRRFVLKAAASGRRAAR